MCNKTHLICKKCSLLKCFRFFIHSVSELLLCPCLYFGFYLGKFYSKFHKVQNTCMLIMFALYHSLGRSVLFTFWLISQKYTFSKKIFKNIDLVLLFKIIRSSKYISALFTFWHIPQKYTFSKKIKKKNASLTKMHTSLQKGNQ